MFLPTSSGLLQKAGSDSEQLANTKYHTKKHGKNWPLSIIITAHFIT